MSQTYPVYSIQVKCPKSSLTHQLNNVYKSKWNKYTLKLYGSYINVNMRKVAYFTFYLFFRLLPPKSLLRQADSLLQVAPWRYRDMCLLDYHAFLL